MDTQRHATKVAIVTGAGSGIGLATLVRLAREGATVVASDIDPGRLENPLGIVRAAGAEATGILADIGLQADVDRLVDETLRRHGRVDILVNNAGINDNFLPAHAVDDATWDRVMTVNVRGPLLLCRRVLPGMVERHAGAIINVASVGGLKGGTSGVAYTASKHALVGMSRSIAWYYASDGIRCNAVCPGGVQTNIGATSVPRDPVHLERLGPIHAAGRRMAEPDEVATLISWLASDEASNVNGAVIPVDGGWSAG